MNEKKELLSNSHFREINSMLINDKKNPYYSQFQTESIFLDNIEKNRIFFLSRQIIEKKDRAALASKRRHKSFLKYLAENIKLHNALICIDMKTDCVSTSDYT